MPRIALVCSIFLGGCFFNAEYKGGQYTCTDGKCPSGLVCSAAKKCVAGIDAAIVDTPADSMIDGSMIDGSMPALTCASPGTFGPTGGMATGSTVGRPSTSSSMCSGGFQNGPDAIYRVSTTAGQHLMISISTTTGGYPVNAYAIASCVVSPNTPVCEGTVAAVPGTPLDLTPAAGMHWIVVDNTNPAFSGQYTLTVSIN